MIIEVKNMRSKALGRKVAFNVILPVDGKNYDPAQKLKTIYLYHGYTDDNTAYIVKTDIVELAEKYNLCVVLPSGENSYFTNDPITGHYWSEFVGKELVEMTRKMFPLSDRREDTYIGGFSMGGVGAMMNGLIYHETFSKIIGFAPDLQLEYLDEMSNDNEDISYRLSFIESHYGDLEKAKTSDYNPLYKAAQLKEAGVTLPEIYMVTGSNDSLAKVEKKAAEAFDKAGVSYIAKYDEGGIHDWKFLQRQLEAALVWAKGE